MGAHLLPGAALDLVVQAEDLHLAAQEGIQLLQPAHRAQLLQDRLLVAVAHGGVLGDVVRQIAGVVAGQHIDQQVGGHVIGQLRIPLEHLIYRAQQRLGPGADPGGLRLRDQLYLGHQEGLRPGQPQHASAAHPFHHHPQPAAGHAQQLPHGGHRAHGIQVLLPRLLHSEFLLPHKEHGAAAGHGVLKGLGGDLPGNVKMDHHAGEHSQAPQRDGRDHGDPVLGPFYCHKNSLPSGKHPSPPAKAGSGKSYG